MKITVINETRSLEKGWHYLTPFNAVCLIASNNFVLNTVTNNGIPSMSYTRYFNEKIPTFDNVPSSMLVRLKLDIEKISNNYSIKPFQNYLRYRFKSDLPKKINTEAEERVFSKSGVIKFNQYILEVQLLNLVMENDVYKVVKINDFILSRIFPKTPLTSREVFDFSLKNRINLTGTYRSINYNTFLPQPKPTDTDEIKKQIELENNKIVNLIEDIDNFDKFCNLVEKACNLKVTSYSRRKEEQSLIYYFPNYKNYVFNIQIEDFSIYYIFDSSSSQKLFIASTSPQQALVIASLYTGSDIQYLKFLNALEDLDKFSNIILSKEDSPKRIKSFKTFVQNNHLPFKVISDKYIIEGSSVPIWSPHSIELSIERWN